MNPRILRYLDASTGSESSQSVRSALENRIVGQKDAVDFFVSLVEKYESRLFDTKRPIGSVLFTGPTGVGKTAVCESFCEALVGAPKFMMLKIDCGEYQHSHEIAKLIGCFVPGTRVLMADGSYWPIEAIKTGDYVISGTGRKRRVNGTHIYNQTGEMVKLWVSGHATEPITTTLTHEILAIKTGRINGKRPTTKMARDVKNEYDSARLKYMPAHELRVGDIVAYPRFRQYTDPPTLDLVDYTHNLKDVHYDNAHIWFQKEFKTNRYAVVDRNFARLAGYFVADGGSDSIRNKNLNFNMHRERKKAALAELPGLFDNVFGTQLSYTDTRASSDRQFFCNKLASTLFDKLFRDRDGEKWLPEWFLYLPDDLVWEFLDAAIMGDGGRSVTRRIDYSTTSETLAAQFELLCSKVGIITQTQIGKSRPGWKTRYRIYMSGDQIGWVCDNLPLTGRTINLENPGKSGIQRQGGKDDQYIYRRITKIKAVNYTGPVHDLAVDTDESYVLSFQVHNSPPGYLGHRETPPLLSRDRIKLLSSDTKWPFAVLLFDEIEKASDALWHLLLAVLDKGELTTGNNDHVDLTHTLVCMTSNVGSSQMSAALGQGGLGFQGLAEAVDNAAIKHIGEEAAKRKFTTEFINRLDAVVACHALSKEEIGRILEKEIQYLQKEVWLKCAPAVPFQVSPAAQQALLDEGYDPKYNARNIKRCIDKHLRLPLARIVAQKQVRPNEALLVDYKDGKYTYGVLNARYEGSEEWILGE